MNAEQIQLLKETHMSEVEANGKKTTLGAYMRFCLDGGIDFVTSKDLVVFDDTNNMLHCVAINEDGRSQANYPIKVISTDYGIVQQVECIYSQENFETMLNNGFMSSIISDEKKKIILNWSQSIRNQAIQPSRATPYYTTDPMIIPAPAVAGIRKDGITHASIDNGLGSINNDTESSDVEQSDVQVEENGTTTDTDMVEEV